MRILITGGAGKLGLNVARILSENNEVRLLDLPGVDFSQFESFHNVECVKGDMTEYSQVKDAVVGVDAVVHLAAILPSKSEKDREKTMIINVGGTENVLRAIREVAPTTHMVFASSVSVYGCTANASLPLRVDQPLAYSDFYSESKVRGEEAIIGSGVTYSILRISGIVFAGLFEFPEILQYKADQRVEFVYIEDVASAIASTVEKTASRNGIFNIAGGKTWQMTGESYVDRVREAIDVDVEVNFSKECGWFDWYDTSRSQNILAYQKTPFDLYLRKLKKVFEELLG